VESIRNDVVTSLAVIAYVGSSIAIMIALGRLLGLH
jgi:hypothetical protein